MGIYNSILGRHPIKTKVATCFAIASLGDYMCQQVTLGRYESYERTL